jgi:hypothetical protein
MSSAAIPAHILNGLGIAEPMMCCKFMRDLMDKKLQLGRTYVTLHEIGRLGE